MLSHRQIIKILALLITISFLLVACERPTPGREETEDVASSGSSVADPNVGGGNDGAEPSEGATTEQSATEETAVTDDQTNTEAESTDEVDVTSEETAVSEDETTNEEEPSEEPSESQEPEENVTEPAEVETQNEENTGQPLTHTVAAGENLYRIGLKYGVSWVTLAQYNNLPNAHQLKIGQVLNIPGSSTPTEEPTPSPSTETTYVVKVGDNLFRIGLSYGISWVQIAEANGLVNANRIAVGQTIKIPISAPGPSPQFTHEVKPNETLSKISLQYGVTWTAIATENQIDPPYVIYVGQTLRIPGK